MRLGTTKPLQVLVVEDKKVNKTLLEKLLAKSTLAVFKVEYSESLDAAYAMLENCYFDVVLLDLNLPDSKGLDTLVRVTEKDPHVAIVVTTGEYDEESGLKAITIGAQEYLVKGTYNAYMLSKSICYAIERKHSEEYHARLLEEIKSANQELTDFAQIVSHDLKAPLRRISTIVDWMSGDYRDKLGKEGQE